MVDENNNSDYKEVPIICPYCGVGCNIELVIENGICKKVIAKGRNEDLNKKFLCIKGLTVPEILNHPDRLKSPLMKSEGEFKEINWEKAINKAADSLKKIIRKYGADSVGVFISGKISNEEAYLSQKFARTVIGTNNVDTCARLCHSPSEVALRRMLGYGAVTACLNDFELADVVILVGANTKFTHPGVWNILRKRTEKNKLIVADLFGVMKEADVKLTPKPSTDLIWLNGLARILYERGSYDKDFIKKRTLGFDNFIKSISKYTSDYVEENSGINEIQLNEIADMIENKRTIFVWGMGLTQHAHGTDAVASVVNLALLTGNIGKKGTGVVPLRGQNNVQGAVDMGGSPFSLPGAFDLTDPGAASHFEGFWNVKLPQNQGKSATEMIHSIADGKIKALYIIGENPLLSEPQSAFVKWMFNSPELELLIVQDIFLTETAKYADVVFSAAALGEKEGLTTNADRRVQYSFKAVEPPGIAKPDWEIITKLANVMGSKWTYSNTEEIWDEIRLLAPIFAGANYSRLKGTNGLFWPIYDEDHPGTKRLYTERFGFRDERARFFPIKPPSFFLQTTEEYPFMLVTHRLYEHFNTGEMTRKSKIAMKSKNQGFISMNEDDAKEMHLLENEKIRINSPYGSVITPIKIITGITIPKKHIFAPIHFFNMDNFNSLTSTYPLDPDAKMPSLKKVPVNIQKIRCDNCKYAEKL